MLCKVLDLEWLRKGRGGVMAASDTTPNTIVLIHGFWVTPRSWEHWKTHFEAKGYTVLTPAYPGFEVEVEALRADPTPIEQLEVPEIIDMLENIIGKLDRPPIIMGHSAGGVFTQILLDHGFGAAGVAINSAPTEGVKVVPLSQIKIRVPGPEEPGEPASRGRLYSGAMALRLREHVQRRGVARALRALPHPCLRQESSGEVLSRTSTPARMTPTSTTTTTRGRRCCSSPGSRITSSRRRSGIRTSSTTSRRPSPRSWSSTDRTCCPRFRSGRRSPTTRSTGR